MESCQQDDPVLTSLYPQKYVTPKAIKIHNFSVESVRSKSKIINQSTMFGRTRAVQ